MALLSTTWFGSSSLFNFVVFVLMVIVFFVTFDDPSSISLSIFSVAPSTLIFSFIFIFIFLN